MKIVSRGYLPSLQKLGIDHFENRNVHWNRLEKLMLFECNDEALRNIANAVRRGLLPALRTLYIWNFEEYDAEIVRTLSQLCVSCHRSYIPSHNDYMYHSKISCLCETKQT